MNSWRSRLLDLLDETCVMLRTGPVIEREVAGPIEVLTVNAMPHADDPGAADLQKIDLVLVTIGVDKLRAEARRRDLVDLLKAWPKPSQLAEGPSYIDLGAVLGDQGAALKLIALGAALQIWAAITPISLKLADPDHPEIARQLACQGAIWCSGFRP